MKFFFLVYTFIFLVTFYNLKAQTQGPNNPGTAINGTCTFGFGTAVTYTPATNVLISDNVYAMATHGPCFDDQTNCLLATNFGFTIPAGATIDGIEVSIEKSTFAPQVEDNFLFILKAGVPVGPNYAQLGVPWPMFDAVSTYGGCSDLWGTAWTPADINNANFGLAFTSIDYSCSFFSVASYIDNVQIKVCYTSTLPLSLINFNVLIQNNSAHLKWQTKSELNVNYFIIQKSTDGVNFKNCDTIYSNSKISVSNNYSSTDPKPYEGISYYRLKTNDFDGKYSYSVIKTAQLSSNIINVFPNPIQTTVNFSIFKQNNLQGIVSLINTHGQEVFDQKIELHEGINNVSINIPSIADGTYFMKLISDDGETLIKKQVIILRN